jgi:hypothetical protein
LGPLFCIFGSKSDATQASQHEREIRSNQTKVLGDTFVSAVDVTNDFELNGGNPVLNDNVLWPPSTAVWFCRGGIDSEFDVAARTLRWICGTLVVGFHCRR